MTCAQARALLAWYDGNGRDLPWRVRSGLADAYRVWLSEVMLQQTTVAVAARRYDLFVRRWPDVSALAAAAEEDVLSAWAGLGYYARARNLHRCARVVAGELGGRFPRDPQALVKLPGIGPYTAAAIAAIAHGVPVAAVDANAERVLARLFAIDRPLPAAKADIRKAARALVPRDRPGDFAQALMDLGALICRPRNPGCGRCPWRSFCKGREMAESLPRRPAPRRRPHRQGQAWLVTRDDGAVLLRRRPSSGLLGGMAELPSAGWDGSAPAFSEEAPFGLTFRPAGEVRHVFTHFTLSLRLWRATAPLPRGAELPPGFFWQPRARAAAASLPSLMRKALIRALKG